MADNKLRLWTTQNQGALKELEDTGVYRAKLENIIEKYDSCSDIYLNVYRWFSSAAYKVVPRPAGVEFPIWAALREELSLGLIKGQVRFELEVDQRDVILYDSGKWDYILNYWYIPADSKDKESYDEKIRAYGIKNQSQIYMTNFYPMLKLEVEKSWERLFDPNIKLSCENQASLWEIRQDWIKKTWACE